MTKTRRIGVDLTLADGRDAYVECRQTIEYDYEVDAVATYAAATVTVGTDDGEQAGLGTFPAAYQLAVLQALDAWMLTQPDDEFWDSRDDDDAAYERAFDRLFNAHASLGELTPWPTARPGIAWRT